MVYSDVYFFMGLLHLVRQEPRLTEPMNGIVVKLAFADSDPFSSVRHWYSCSVILSIIMPSCNKIQSKLCKFICVIKICFFMLSDKCTTT
jgi:hypothetical protein